jgi:hypothetical protein
MGLARTSFVLALASLAAIALYLALVIAMFFGAALTTGSGYERLTIMLGIVIGGAVAGVVAIVTGIRELVSSNRNRARSPSRALAIQGIVLGSLAIVVHIAFLTLLFVLLMQLTHRTCIPNGC